MCVFVLIYQKVLSVLYDNSEYGVCDELVFYDSSSWEYTDGHFEEGQLYIVRPKTLCQPYSLV